VRIGISLAPAAVPAVFGDAVDRVEELGVDSLWLSEMVFGSLVEPFAGMAYALSRTSRLKAGTGVAVLPGRHPVLVAKHLASLAGLALGRVLPVFGLRPARPAELGLFEVPAGRRAAVFEESLRLIRLLLTRERVSFQGGPIQRSLPLSPSGWSRSTFSIAPATAATASRVHVRAEGSRIRPACTLPSASYSAASGRKSWVLFVTTARPSPHATSKMIRSLRYSP
jgi:alkanesulfonate monooxygenase SsuD/methylene tetrahydromethanopterin reductase-like flavin-dependent oxidoreductase (luciferase family)